MQLTHTDINYQRWIHICFIFINISLKLQQLNGDGLSLPLQTDLDSIKADIIREMRVEINKAKQEIIEGKTIVLNF